MLVNILIFIVAGLFSVYVLYSACRKYIGRNPQAPSLWARFKAWWPGFVKRHIVDDDPYQDESHAGTRYADDYIDWAMVPKGYDWVAADDKKSACGWICAFPSRPDGDLPGIWRVGHDGEEYIPLSADAIIGPLPPWRESLRHRPGK